MRPVIPQAHHPYKAAMPLLRRPQPSVISQQNKLTTTLLKRAPSGQRSKKSSETAFEIFQPGLTVDPVLCDPGTVL
jgi:hypothetical protein